MIKNIDRIPLSNIELKEEAFSPIKHNIKILKRKLPEDFFFSRPAIHFSTEVVRNAQRQPPSTSNFTRKPKKQEALFRDIVTARDFDSNKDQDLIQGVLKSARQMKKVFRKHSVQLKKELVPKKKTSQFDLQLPPLFLKKGVTTAF